MYAPNVTNIRLALQRRRRHLWQASEWGPLLTFPSQRARLQLWLLSGFVELTVRNWPTQTPPRTSYMLKNCASASASWTLRFYLLTRISRLALFIAAPQQNKYLLHVVLGKPMILMGGHHNLGMFHSSNLYQHIWELLISRSTEGKDKEKFPAGLLTLWSGQNKIKLTVAHLRYKQIWSIVTAINWTKKKSTMLC